MPSISSRCRRQGVGLRRSRTGDDRRQPHDDDDAGAAGFAEFEKLLKAWGVAFDTSKVAGDISRARRVQFGSGPRSSVTEYVLWLGLDKRNLDERDVLDGRHRAANFASAGFLEKAAERHHPVHADHPHHRRCHGDPGRKRQHDPSGRAAAQLKRGGRPLVIAARVSGERPARSPMGLPPTRARTQGGGREGQGEARRQGTAAKGKKPRPTGAATRPTRRPSSAPEKKAEYPPPAAAKLLVNGKINVVVVADSDFLHDQFWVEMREFLGQR